MKGKLKDKEIVKEKREKRKIEWKSKRKREKKKKAKWKVKEKWRRKGKEKKKNVKEKAKKKRNSKRKLKEKVRKKEKEKEHWNNNQIYILALTKFVPDNVRQSSGFLFFCPVILFQPCHSFLLLETVSSQKLNLVIYGGKKTIDDEVFISFIFFLTKICASFSFQVVSWSIIKCLSKGFAFEYIQ